MKHKYFLIKIFFLLLIAFFSCNNIGSAETFGPSEWTQFRLNPENNAVFQGEFNRTLESMTIETNDEIRSTPVVVGDNVYIGNHNSGDIYSYNLIDKKMNWTSKAPNWIHSEIIYANDQLFVGYGNRFFNAESDTRGTGESGLLSLDPKTGKILWNFKTEGEVMPTPAFYKDTVYITTGDKHLYGVDPQNGTEKWRLKLGHVTSMSSPNIKDGILYVGTGYREPYTFFAVDLDNREVLWSTEFPGVYAGLDDVPPSIYNDQLVFTTAIEESKERLSIRQVYENEGVTEAYKQMVKIAFGDFINKPSKKIPNHMLYAMDIRTGEIKWETSLGKGLMVANNKSGAPVVYKDKVFVGSPITKKFYAFGALSGEQIWSYDSHVNKAPPVADKDQVFFTDTKGMVYAFQTDSGKLLGKKQLGGKLAPSGPVLMNDHLVVGSQDSNVYILPTEEIINAEDEVRQSSEKTTKSFISYVLTIYLLPILILIAVILLIFFVFKKVNSLKRSS
jgi:outer membrane protein assembly factor BamB